MKITFFLSLLILLLSSCNAPQNKQQDGTFNIVTTTSIITDLVENIGGENVHIEGVMGAGVDPHLYKASEGDVMKLSRADMIFYNGLHLEGKLVDIFERMEYQNIKTVAVADALDKNELINSELFGGNFDPHIWFNIKFWEKITLFVADELSKAVPEHEEEFQKNAQNYLQELKYLDVELHKKIAELPKDKRRLVTAHDAFSYFGKAFDFDVVGLQGLSTATEAGVQDVQETANYIIDHKVNAIFIESSVPRRTIEALQASVNSKDHNVKIGGTLYSDALGNPGTVEGTYIGMFKYNVETIVNALK
ncbi:manganese transporter [Brumimicrobium salinarum]|uniref:Manganese transporter n=1 Tax=Brumimicrobium salinarum TaxID=2058658 RepID=A0A2I0R3W1_9FLAO|nr:zinc ABC transporter substrate-binding protein [Brumimicrobium salinarum]PKR81274.1 manganese transporter [Brumimicrobium salinarum]